jgi:hypothetical protein
MGLALHLNTVGLHHHAKLTLPNMGGPVPLADG